MSDMPTGAWSKGNAMPVEPEPELPELRAIQTYGPGYWAKDLCLATRHDPGDPMPTVCARERHPHDPRHLTVIWHHAGNRADQTTWREEQP